MSRHYGRGYHRRGSAVCQTSFTIDKLFKESNNKPSASRSAGTVGKWGITSFTTIRGSGFGSKYGSSAKNEKKEVKDDNYSFDAETKKKEEPLKPKKFFKSRNAGPTAATETLSPIPEPDDPCASGSKVSPPKSSPQSDGEHKPPIVLRIFKGTSCLVADGSDSAVSPPRQSPRGDKSPGGRGRRRSTQEEPSWSPRGRRRSAIEDSPSTVTPRPKRLRREVIKDPAIQNIISQLISDDEDAESGVESQPLALTASTLPVDSADDTKNLTPSEFYPQSSANKENEPKPEEIDIKESEDLSLIEQAQLLLSEHVAPLIPPKSPSPVRQTIKMDVGQESDEDSDSQDQQDSGVVLTSKVESGGLKLVIKKTPDSHNEQESLDPKPTKVMPAKKKSIFKSRSKEEAGNAKRLALYKHNWNSAHAEKPPEGPATVTRSFPELDVDAFSVATLTRVAADPRPGSPNEEIAKIRCDKKDKGYYTVIRNVKKAHQIQESGEFQEFNDDVEYILDALQDNNPIGTRCLSAITLASKCSAPAFRMHVRAHGTVAKFFRALHDATQDPSLGLCTATIMFVLSQDRLNMDLDRDSLELMLGLLESDASHTNALDDCGMSSSQLHKNREKVKELCAEIQAKGLAKHLNLENITVRRIISIEILLIKILSGGPTSNGDAPFADISACRRMVQRRTS